MTDWLGVDLLMWCMSKMSILYGFISSMLSEYTEKSYLVAKYWSSPSMQSSKL